MIPKHKTKSIIPQHTPNKQNDNKYLNKDLRLKSYKDDGNKATVLISLGFVQEEFECFSDWSKQEMKEFWGFNRLVHDYIWQDILEQGGKQGKKVGFGCTKIERDQYPKGDFIAKISPDVSFYELRLDSKIRVHGFRDDSIFYICWLDRNHRICD